MLNVSKTEYPFASHWLDLGGLRYHYVDEGAGKPILFVHGNPTWSFAWRRFVRALSPQYRTIAVDHIGCGYSDKPQDYAYTIDSHVSNLCRLIEKLDLRDITLVGPARSVLAVRADEHCSLSLSGDSAAHRNLSHSGARRTGRTWA